MLPSYNGRRGLEKVGLKNNLPYGLPRLVVSSLKRRANTAELRKRLRPTSNSRPLDTMVTLQRYQKHSIPDFLLRFLKGHPLRCKKPGNCNQLYTSALNNTSSASPVNQTTMNVSQCSCDVHFLTSTHRKCS